MSSLKSPNITFWTLWINDELAGCGALKKLNNTHAELKSMRTSQRFLRKGVASKLLRHILEMAKKQSFEKISLETGRGKSLFPLNNSINVLVLKYASHFQIIKKIPIVCF